MPDAPIYRVGPQPGGPLFVPDAPIYRVGPQPGGPLFVPDTPNNREELRAREPSKYLNRRSYGERPAKEASDHSKKLEKKTDRAKASIVEAVHVPVHLAPPESLQTKQAMPPSCSTLTGAEQLQAKKVLHLGTQGHFGHVQLFATL